MSTNSTKVVRVSLDRLERIRDLLGKLPDSRLGRGETPIMQDAQVVDIGLGWMEGRLLNDTYTGKEAEDFAVNLATKVLALHLDAKVNVMLADGKATFDISDKDGIASHVTIDLDPS